MPLPTFAELTEDQPVLSGFGNRLAKTPPGIVLTTGQSASGKVTMLLALAQVIAQPGQAVRLLSSRPDEFKVFRPLPPGWVEEVVPHTQQGWREALQAQPGDALVIVAALDRESTPPLWELPAGRWLLAALDSPLIGHDVTYALRELNVSAESFLERTRCVWSQFLVDVLCAQCAVPAQLSTTEMDDLFPGHSLSGKLLDDGTCTGCDNKGAKGKVAVCEAILITDETRAAISKSLQDGSAPQLAASAHVKVHEQAREFVEKGEVSVATYRAAILRNPLLRAQNTLEREQAHSFKLGAVFEKFVSPEVKRRLMDSRTIESVVGGESRDVTCLFCDIRGFTARAESLPPETLFSELNRYFAEVVDCVLANEGTIDKFIGDAVMVVFGAPMAQPDQAQRALACALAIRERVISFNASNPGNPPIAVGMGINSGVAMAGCIGTDRRMEYTVLGDAVNVAARLESRARPGQVLVSRATRELAGAAFLFGAPRSFELKGKAADVEASELLGAS